MEWFAIPIIVSPFHPRLALPFHPPWLFAITRPHATLPVSRLYVAGKQGAGSVRTWPDKGRAGDVIHRNILGEQEAPPLSFLASGGRRHRHHHQYHPPFVLLQSGPGGGARGKRVRVSDVMSNAIPSRSATTRRTEIAVTQQEGVQQKVSRQWGRRSM